MIRRWITVTLIAIILTVFFIWAKAGEGLAAKDERWYPIKILKKLDVVLANQKLILQEIRALNIQAKTE